MLTTIPTLLILATLGALARLSLASDAERRKLEARANAATCSYALSGGSR